MASLFVITSAFADPVLSISDIKLKPGGTTKVEISLANDLPVAGANFELYLPDGLSYVMEDGDEYTILNLERDYKGGSIDVSLFGNNLNVVLSNNRGNTIEKGDGVLLSFQVKADENAALKADAKIDVKEINISVVKDGKPTNVTLNNFQSNVNIFNVFNVSAKSADEATGTATISPSGEVESGTSITATAAPNDGYSFVNWTNAEGTEISAVNPYTFELAAATALTANFKAIQYPVVFKNDGAEVKNETIDFASVITAPKNPTKEGYTFLGWFDGNDVKFVEGATVPLNGVTYTAKWQINQYTITFDTDGGSTVDAITLPYGSQVVAPENPTKTGYTFAGWNPELPETMPVDGMNTKATWTINQYTVKFVADDVVVSEELLDYGTAITAPEVPAKEGYTGAWDKAVAETVPADNVTYTAVYTPIDYTITFDTDGGSVVEAVTLPYGSAITAPAAPTKTGYTFAGWNPALPETMPVDGMNTKAIWIINQYTVKFVADDVVVSEELLDYGTAITAPEVPAKEGYTGAWDKAVAETVPADNVTYTAVYTPIDYTITFDTDGGSVVEAVTLPYGSAITAPAAPTKTGYTFAGWNPALPETMPVDGMNTKAIWTINQYTVKFVADGVVVSEETLDYGSAITEPKEPTKDSHIFKGWYSEDLGWYSASAGVTVPDFNVTYTAQWELDKVTVRFVFWDDNKFEYELDPGAEITVIPEVPAREGYTFKGWDKDIPKYVPETGGELVINAVWSINKYAVYFIANKKTVYSAILPYGSEIVAPEAPEVEGYTFVGWTPEVDATVPARTVYYEAVYEVNTYKVTYYLNDEVVNVAEVKYGEAIPAYEPTVEEGMKFDGWQEEIPAVMPAYDLEIHGTTSGIETAIKNIVAKFGETFDVYNVSGRLVQRVNGASDISRIPAGMYIINGTKVVIRKD